VTAAFTDSAAATGAVILTCVLTIAAIWASDEASKRIKARRRRDHAECEDQAPALARPPVPGQSPPQVPPARRAPASGQIHPQHGARLLSADFYEDGAVLVHDHLRRKTTKFEAPEVDPGIDWDDWLKGLPR
jgi:hypothetical protein